MLAAPSSKNFYFYLVFDILNNKKTSVIRCFAMCYLLVLFDRLTPTRTQLAAPTSKNFYFYLVFDILSNKKTSYLRCSLCTVLVRLVGFEPTRA
ncbi:MAG: hypothetical protein GYA50_03870 [Eubacteriaceae bacterium]|nr:hypothetical protein [Eubacteriaceae bacterium]